MSSCWRCARCCSCWTRSCTPTWRRATASPSSSATAGCSSPLRGSSSSTRWVWVAWGNGRGGGLPKGVPFRPGSFCKQHGCWIAMPYKPCTRPSLGSKQALGRAPQRMSARRLAPPASNSLAASHRPPLLAARSHLAGAAAVGGAVGGAARPAPLPVRCCADAAPPHHPQARGAGERGGAAGATRAGKGWPEDQALTRPAQAAGRAAAGACRPRTLCRPFYLRAATTGTLTRCCSGAWA